MAPCENKFIMQSDLFENEVVGPEVLESSVQQTRALRRWQRHKAYATERIMILTQLFGIFAGSTFVKD